MPPAPPPSRSLDRVLLVVLTLLVGYQIHQGLTVQKSLGWDPAMGFLTLQSSLEHGDFNRLHHPDPDNLATDRAEFVAWWTPGQYLLPHGVAQMLHTDPGFALRLIAVGGSVVGLLGCALLFRRLGFDRTTVRLGLIAIASQPYFLAHGRVYLGGELLLFAGAPYLILTALSPRWPLAGRAALATLAAIAALWLKASALTIYCALTLAFALEILGWPAISHAKESAHAPGLRWRRFALLAALFTGFLLAMHFLYLADGVSIGSAPQWPGAPDPERLWNLAVAFSGPWYGAFGWLESWNNHAAFVCLAVLGTAGAWLLCRDRPNASSAEHRRLLAAHYVAFALFFSYAYLRGLGISSESRHFRWAGLLLIPGAIHAMLVWRPRFRTTLAGGLAVLSLAGAGVDHATLRPSVSAPDSVSRWGIRQPVGNDTLAALQRADDTIVTADTIVLSGFGAAPSLLLEFRHGRRLIDRNFAYFRFGPPPALTPEAKLYRGTAKHLVVLVSRNARGYFGPPVEEIARAFEHPPRLRRWFENDEIVIYEGRAGPTP